MFQFDGKIHLDGAGGWALFAAIHSCAMLEADCGEAGPMTDSGKQTLGAVEAGGTKFVCALTDTDGGVLAQSVIPTRDPNESFADMRGFFEGAAERHGAPAAFGIASFGPIDIDPASPGYGRILTTTKPHWTDARYTDALGTFGVPMAFDTDVNGAALGEWASGAGQGADTLAYVTVGTGIGGAVLHKGVALNGSAHYEMGHIRVPHDRERDPFAGHCAFHGDCLEGLAAGPAIRARWRAELSALGVSHEAVSLEAEYLAHMAATITLMHRPDRIIFGGGVMKSPGLIEALRERTVDLLGGYLDGIDGDLTEYIVLPGLGDQAGLTGAIILAQRALAG